MTCTKCSGCLEWEKNEVDWNLMCRNCAKRYYNALPPSTIEQDIALWKEQGKQAQRRAA